MTTRTGRLWWLLAAALVFGETNSAEPPKIQGQPAVVKTPAASGQFQYVAETVDTVRQAGPVIASGITWHCKDRSCSVAGPWPVPGIAACQALAAAVGPLRSYGHSSRYLTPDELEQCNRGQQSLAPKPATTAAASPQPEPPTMPLPGIAPGKVSAAPASAGPASTPVLPTGVTPTPPRPGGAGTGRVPEPGAWPGEPGTPAPIPGSRGPGEESGR